MAKLASNEKRLGSIQRVLDLIRRFNDGERLCINTLLDDPLWIDLSERTIRRDLGLINEVFPNLFQHIDGTSGCYKAITQDMFKNIVTPQEMALITQIFKVAEKHKLYDNLNISKEDKRLIEKQIKKSEEHYIFKSQPLEHKYSNLDTFKKLEHAINFQKEIKILFPMSSGETKRIQVRPYKILFMNANFYLASERTDKKGHFARYRISRIEEVEITNINFKKVRDIDEFIVVLQTPFATYQTPFRQHLISVVLEADITIFRYFKQKDYLPNQKLKKLENDKFQITYTVTNEREVESIIKRWIPLIEVIEPLSLKEKIHKDLTTYLQSH